MLCKKPVGCRKLSGVQGEVLKWKKKKLYTRGNRPAHILISVRSGTVSSTCRDKKNLECLLKY